jgi:hypothetical protein
VLLCFEKVDEAVNTTSVGLFHDDRDSLRARSYRCDDGAALIGAARICTRNNVSPSVLAVEMRVALAPNIPIGTVMS